MAGLREIIIEQGERDSGRFANLPDSLRKALELEVNAIVIRVDAQHGWWHAVDSHPKPRKKKAA